MKEDVKLKMRVTWKLEKFDGEAPLPGEHKLPVEVIEGGDDLPTVVSYPQENSNATD